MQRIIKTTIYADLSKEYMYDVAKKLGLSNEAANYFKYFNEVALEVVGRGFRGAQEDPNVTSIEIDKETGEVLDVKVPL